MQYEETVLRLQEEAEEALALDASVEVPVFPLMCFSEEAFKASLQADVAKRSTGGHAADDGAADDAKAGAMQRE